MFSGKQRLTRLAQNCKYVELYEELSQFFPYKGLSQLFYKHFVRQATAGSRYFLAISVGAYERS